MAKPGLCDQPLSSFQGLHLLQWASLLREEAQWLEVEGFQKVEMAVWQDWRQRVYYILYSSMSTAQPLPRDVIKPLLPPYPGVWKDQTQTLHSCSRGKHIGTGGSLPGCLPSLGGSHTHPHDTPPPECGALKGFTNARLSDNSEEPSTSWVTICAHVHWNHSGARLACPSCAQTFLNLDALRHHKKIHTSRPPKSQ